MKKLLNRFLPHLTVSCSLALIVLAIVNGYNPRMGFLQGTEAQILITVTGILSVLTAIVLIAKTDKE